MPLLPLEEKDLSWINVTIEMDLNRVEYSRTRYTVLDLLAAFGGFMGIFRWIFGTFMQAWNFQALDNFLISKLYQAKLANKKAFNQVEALERSRLPHIGAYMLSWVPTCLQSNCCVKRQGKDLVRAKARKRLGQEMDIVHLIRT